MKKLNTQIQETRSSSAIIHLSPTISSQEEVITAPPPIMAVEQAQMKLQGKATAELKSLTAEQVWPLWADFCGLYKWFPNLASSTLIEGETGKVGSVRHCAGKVLEATDEVKWAREKLVYIDHDKRRLMYEVVENNVGLKDYVATIRVWDVVEDQEGAVGVLGCKVEWSFEADEVEGWGVEVMQGYVEICLQAIVRKMEEALTETGAKDTL